MTAGREKKGEECVGREGKKGRKGRKVDALLEDKT